MIRRLLIALALAAALPAAARPAAPTVVTPAGDMSQGAREARVEVVEYASLTCPHCARLNSEVIAPFRARYVDTGKARYTLKEFITPPDSVAAAGWLVARCAGKDRYFAVVDEVFRSQPEMFSDAGPRAVLLRIAKAHGLTEAQFTACIADKAAVQALSDRVERAARDDKVRSTPTVFVNGERVAEGEMSLAELEAAIAQADRRTRRK